MKLNRIKLVLVEKDLSQNDFMAMMAENDNPKNVATISRWCRNQQQPNLETLNKIAEVLDVDICDLIVRNKAKKGQN